MTQSQKLTLSKSVVEGLSSEGEDVVFWDQKLSGFGVRVYPSGKKVYVIQTRAFGRSNRISIGRYEDLSVHKAREISAEIIARIKKGQPPFPPEPTPEPTVADLAERYMREYVELHCKPVTVSHYRGILRKHIVPVLGELLVRAVTHSDVLAFHTGLYRVPTVANRTIDMLGHMFRLADQWEWRPTGRNPCEGVPRYKIEQLRERFLTREELARLGSALREAPAKRLASTHAAAAIRLLVLTGCRRNEILGLRWDDLNFDTGVMRLTDTKTGTRMVPMPPAVARVFEGLTRTPGNPWVFRGRKKGTRLVNLNDSWERVRKHAGLEDVRLHDLRHTYASRALALGYNLPMIADLLGHTMVSTTARYAHLERNAVREAAADVAADIAPRIMPSLRQ